MFSFEKKERTIKIISTHNIFTSVMKQMPA